MPKVLLLVRVCDQLPYTNCYSIESITLGTCRIFSDSFVVNFDNKQLQFSNDQDHVETLSEYANRWKVEGKVTFNHQHGSNILQDIFITLFDIDEKIIISIDNKKNVKVSK